MNFSDDSDLEDPFSVEAQLAEELKRRGTASQGRGRARNGPSLKTVTTAAPGSVPKHPGLGGRTRRAKKVASGHCEELGPEIMRTIPEEELTDNQLEMSFEILRGSDGEESASGMLARVGDRDIYVLGDYPGAKAQEMTSAKDSTERAFSGSGMILERRTKEMAGGGKSCSFLRWEGTSSWA